MSKFKLIIPVIVVSINLITCNRIAGWVAPFVISDEQEVELGNSFKAEIDKDSISYPHFHGDARVSKFVDSLGQKIADRQSDRESLEFTFTVLEDTSINAFAIPGGHVYVNTGLLKNADNLAEVAGVIAHEVGHITQYHGRDLFLEQAAFGYASSILFGDSASIASALAALVGNMTFLKYSRDNEFEADSCAVAYSTLAGVNPIGMRNFLQKLKDRYGNEPKIFEPFSTHPPLSDRIDRVEKVIEKVPGASMESDTLLYTDEFEAIRSLL
ncbi:MAG: M48 family metalloprotease [Chitinispirillaceae bacterium]|nr:M48 family metalloprotease [Chitinispirillaceae bacterium]